MPRELVAVAPRRAEIREYEPPPLEAGMVRIVSEFGAPKHGSEMTAFRPPERPAGRYDAGWRCFVDDRPRITFPRALGNMIVGRITEVGEGVEGFAPGDRVYGYLPLRDVHVVPAAPPVPAGPHRNVYDRVRPLPPGLSDEAAVCLDPADAALAMRDAHVRIGDRVAVFGLGAIGLMALQLCRLSGASLVVGVDPIAARRDVAAGLGADAVVDPSEVDAGMELRRMTGRTGVDVALEVSGSSRALHQAIRGTRYAGTVGVIASFPAGAPELYLGQEFHQNAVKIVSCRSVSLPLVDYGWDRRRTVGLAEDLLRTGRLRADGVVQPIVPFERSAEAYREIDEHPEQSVKLGVRFGTAGP
jgi:threonine dehydrogenase-like Zn-dependent dehydrogenase